MVKEGFFNEEGQVEQMTALSQNLDDQLRRRLNIGDDFLLDEIRQAQVKNWLKFLVIPSRQ